ncbi:MAG: DUF1294 domain-containing protein [Clostridia bacterium]|nr:DUF1294 domain-containing protein [Clostridia bacterium]
MIWGWFLGMNLLTFALFGIDKQRAKQKKYRIAEKILFALSLLGGSVGALLGMQIFRHKTKRLSFLIGIPLCFLFNAILLSLLLK